MKEENDRSLVHPVDETKRPGFTFWLIWVFGSGAAFTILLLVGFPLSTAILDLLGYRGRAIDSGGPFMFYLTFSFALGGLGIGLVQWLLIRKRLEISGWWMISWIIGMSLVSVISILLEDVTSQTVSELVHNAIAGIVVGSIHYLILRRQTDWAASWFVGIVVSFVAAGVTAFVLSLFFEDFEGASFATLVGMAISGLIMIRYLRSDSPKPLFPRGSKSGYKTEKQLREPSSSTIGIPKRHSSASISIAPRGIAGRSAVLADVLLPAPSVG